MAKCDELRKAIQATLIQKPEIAVRPQEESGYITKKRKKDKSDANLATKLKLPVFTPTAKEAEVETEKTVDEKSKNCRKRRS
jgi:hypothetical protein